MKARKILALVLAFAMILSTMGTVVFAEDTTGSSVAYIDGTGYETLQAAIDAVQNGETIKIATSVNETVMVNKNGVAFAIDGAIDGTDENVTFDGTIQINIGQNLVISNIDFVHSVVEDYDFISNVGSPTGKNYNTTLVVEDCSFTGDRGASMVAVRSKHPTDITIRNCVGTGLHSLIQNTGGQKVTVDNVTITDSKSGVSLGGVRAADVKNSSITVDESYGIRIDAATDNAVHNIENCVISAFVPVVARKATANNVDITVSGDNTMTATNTDGIWFAVGIEEYENNGDVLTAPTGTVDVVLKDTELDAEGVSGADAETFLAKVGNEAYNDINKAINAAINAAPATVQLAAGEYDFGTITLGVAENITIKGAKNGGTVIKNTLITNAGKATDNISNITFDDIVFDNSRIYVNGWTAGMNFANWTITNCVFKNLESSTSIGGVIQFNLSSGMIVGAYGPYNDVALDGFTFTNNVVDGAQCNGVCSAINSQAMEGTIIIENNIFNNIEFNAIQMQNVPADATVSIKNNTFTNIGKQILHLNNNIADVDVNENVFVKIDESSYYISHISTRIDASGNYFGIGTSVDDAVFDADYRSKFKTLSGVEAPIVVSYYDDAALVEKIITAEAKIGDVYYETFTEALAAAQSDDNIDLLGRVLDLPEGNGIKITKDLTISNGTIDITDGVWNGNSIFEICGGTQNDFVTVTFNDVDFIGDNYSSAFGVIYAYDFGKAIINNCNFTLSNEKYSSGGVLKGNGIAGSAFDVTDSSFDLENPNRIITNATVNLNGVEIDAAVTDETLVVGEMNNHALRNVSGTIKNTNISIDGFETGIKNTDGSLVVSDNSNVVITNSADTDLIVSSASTLSVDETSLLTVDTSDVAANAVSGNVVKKADAVEVDFEFYNEEETEITYDIVLKGINAETINRLNSADLTFALSQTTGQNAYEIVDVADDHITFNPVYNVEDGSIIDGRYEFHFDTKTGVSNDTASEIVIARVKFTGYGTFGFGVAEAGTNAVHATKIRDNIVDTYVPNGDTSSIAEGELVIDNDFSEEIAIPRRALTVKVSFPNGINENDAAYQNMSISVVGDGVSETVKLGKGLRTDANGVVYYAELFGDTILNTPYTVTLEGAGYRTVKYTVNMTEAKTLNFWNNVKDNEVYVEESVTGIKKYAQKVTFLAGDIVKDNEINVYDLSAVVSYFGEIDLDKDYKSEYAKYDLNRDGKIDSKDVAYVLVSWGN